MTRCLPWRRSAHALQAVLAVLTIACGTSDTTVAPRIAGVYAFHHPYRDADVDAFLAKLGAAADPDMTAYVHDGEWGVREGRPKVVRGQAYPDGARHPLMLVYHGEPELVAALPALDAVAIVTPLAARARDLAARGLPVRGVQLDFDAGPRGLERYPELLAGLRQELPGLRLSVTALASTAGLPVWRKIGDMADEVCPMLYGFEARRRDPRFDAATSRSFLAKLSFLDGKLVPVLGRGRVPLDPAALDLVARAGGDRHLVFDLGMWGPRP